MTNPWVHVRKDVIGDRRRELAVAYAVSEFVGWSIDQGGRLGWYEGHDYLAFRYRWSWPERDSGPIYAWLGDKK